VVSPKRRPSLKQDMQDRSPCRSPACSLSSLVVPTEARFNDASLLRKYMYIIVLSVSCKRKWNNRLKMKWKINILKDLGKKVLRKKKNDLKLIFVTKAKIHIVIVSSDLETFESQSMDMRYHRHKLLAQK